jgi:hypothetical protein
MPATLNYQSTPARRWWISARLWIILAILAAILITAISLPPRWAAYRERLHKQDLMPTLKADAPGPNVIAYEDNIARAAQIGRPNGYVTICGWDNKPRVARLPAAWFELRWDCWGWWDSETADKPILFAHSRISPSGVKRVVIVYAVPTWPNDSTVVSIRSLVLDSNGDAWNAPASWPGGFSTTLVRTSQSSGNGLRIFAGQADPADSSHFTIEYEIDGAKNKIDGWLADAKTSGPNSQQSVWFGNRSNK